MIAILYATITVVAFYFGIVIGQKLSKGEDVQPKIDVKTIKRAVPFTKEHKKEKAEQKQSEEMMEKFIETAKYIDDYGKE